MSYAFPEGSKFFFSETFASAKTVTAVSNANPAVATSVAHGFADGAELLFESGWEDASDSVFKIDQLSVDTFSLPGLNTNDTDWFNPGSGTGTVQLVSNWVEIPQVLTIATQGGDPKFTTIAPLAKRNAINVPTGFNPTSITLTLGHDASNTNYQEMLDISRSLRKVAFKMVLSGGISSYGYGYMSVSEMPSLNVNQANQVTASLSLLGRAISYAS
ncbi:phage tail tube protein [Paraburkholderia franconis]|uniref:phage tail tube protein n=1 Tax=Paraburkholderia franconis TaxID=2654983 RepID=UPI00128E6D5B|nr:phage tail tube protein [Paraburkholderia franconis]